MNLIENFKISNSGWKTAFTSTDGDDVDMKVEDVLLYTFLPFGQLFMRIFKYNGSLDKIYLLLGLIGSGWFVHRLFDTYEPNYWGWLIISYFVASALNAIPAVLGYYKKLNKVDDEQSSVFDFAILIPIFCRFLFGFAMIYINFYVGDFIGPIMIHLTLFLFIMLAVFIRLVRRRQCNSTNNQNTGKRFVKVLFDSIFIYTIIFIISGMVLKMQKFEGYMSFFATPVPYYGTMGDFMLMIGWAGGALLGYMFNNMLDTTFNTKFEPPYNDDDVCKGEISSFKITVTSILLIVSVIYYVSNSRYSGFTNQVNYMDSSQQGGPAAYAPAAYDPGASYV